MYLWTELDDILISDKTGPIPLAEWSRGNSKGRQTSVRPMQCLERTGGERKHQNVWMGVWQLELIQNWLNGFASDTGHDLR